MDEAINFHDGMINPVDAVRGWDSLRAMMRSWGVFHRADLTQWLRGHGFAAVQPGNHISARAQEFLFEKCAGTMQEVRCSKQCSCD